MKTAFTRRPAPDRAAGSDRAAGADQIAGSGIVARLSALHPRLIDLSLERVERLLRRLGDPHLALPRVVHVAGTNGKGSTIAFMRAGLEAAGLRVNVYTSPHLVRFTERIRLGGREITEDALLQALERAETANAGQPITFFEILTAAAFLACAETPADVTLVEVGLGGRFDATNVFPVPAAAVIAHVSVDHVEFLSDDVAKIAWEKAGVLKPGRPGVVAAQAAAPGAVIERVAREVGAPLSLGGRDWTALATDDGFVFQDGGARYALPRPALAGDWQIGNAGLALAVLNRLPDFTLTEGIAAAAVASVQWPARLQPIRQGPLADMLRPRALWLDGGHNPGAAAALAETLAAWSTPPRLILGMQANKDAAAYLRHLAPLVRRVETVAIPGAASSFDAEALAAEARAAGLEAAAQPSLDAAVAAVAADQSDAPVLIAGSLFLAGEVLKGHGS